MLGLERQNELSAEREQLPTAPQAAPPTAGLLPWGCARKTKPAGLGAQGEATLHLPLRVALEGPSFGHVDPPALSLSVNTCRCITTPEIKSVLKPLTAILVFTSIYIISSLLTGMTILANKGWF